MSNTNCTLGDTRPTSCLGAGSCAFCGWSAAEIERRRTLPLVLDTKRGLFRKRVGVRRKEPTP